MKRGLISGIIAMLAIVGGASAQESWPTRPITADRRRSVKAVRRSGYITFAPRNGTNPACRLGDPLSTERMLNSSLHCCAEDC